MSALHIDLPPWLAAFAAQYQADASLKQRMDFVIAAAASNIAQGTGGPFAAGIFRLDNHALVALGVNLVPSTGLSILHAEMLALSLAQRAIGNYNLQGHEIISSAEPCSMCFGALPWSGISQLVCAATDADVRTIGFDEGAKVNDWQAALENRGIHVISHVQRQNAVQVLQAYQQQDGDIYNACSSR